MYKSFIKGCLTRPCLPTTPNQMRSVSKHRRFVAVGLRWCMINLKVVLSTTDLHTVAPTVRLTQSGFEAFCKTCWHSVAVPPPVLMSYSLVLYHLCCSWVLPFTDHIKEQFLDGFSWLWVNTTRQLPFKWRCWNILCMTSFLYLNKSMALYWGHKCPRERMAVIIIVLQCFRRSTRKMS